MTSPGWRRGAYAIVGGFTKKWCNPKSISLNKKKVNLAVGKTFRLKATVKGVKSGRKLLSNARKVRWFSSNRAVATVNGNGVVKGVSKGSCTIYAITVNGFSASAKVKVSAKSNKKKK